MFTSAVQKEIMTFDLNLTKEFESNTCRLTYLAQESYAFYEELRRTLKLMQKMGLPSIGNPVLKLENEILTLVYSVMQHQTNCELYATLITDTSSATDLGLQLTGLYEMTGTLSINYYNCLERWAGIKDQQERRVLAIRTLSIPA